MKKTLIITLHQGYNYGGMMQAYALQRIIKGFGGHVETTATIRPVKSRISRSHYLKWAVRKIKGNSNRSIKLSQPTTKHTVKFVQRYLQQVSFPKAVIKSSLGRYTFYVTGSDQVWRSRYTHVPHNMFSFVARNNTKISYAASFGTEDLREYSPKLIQQTSKLAKKMTAISVREDVSIRVVNEKWGVNAIQHVDPTLLIDAEEYSRIVEAEDAKLLDNKGLFIYVLDKEPAKLKMLDTIVDKLKINSFSVIDKDDNGGEPMPPVTQWLKSFIDADFVVTDSFHGCVFSIIFNKPFIAIGNEARGLARFTSLLSLFGLQDRLIVENMQITDKLLRGEIDWGKVNEIKRREQARSVSYLKKYMDESIKLSKKSI